MGEDGERSASPVPVVPLEDDDIRELPSPVLFFDHVAGQEEFDQAYTYHNKTKASLPQSVRIMSKHYHRPLKSRHIFCQKAMSFVPILEWLPKYNWKEDFVSDVFGGFTMGIMHVPQGIAYAILANLDPVVGLYTAFLPALVYMFFGTSRHMSIGSFAVVSLMTGLAVSRITGVSTGEVRPNEQFIEDNGNSTAVPTPIEVAATITFATGIVQSVYDIGSHILETNLVTLSLSIGTVVLLVVVKEVVNPLIKKKINAFQLPAELLAVIIGTLIVRFVHLDNHGVDVVGEIPTG